MSLRRAAHSNHSVSGSRENAQPPPAASYVLRRRAHTRIEEVRAAVNGRDFGRSRRNFSKEHRTIVSLQTERKRRIRVRLETHADSRGCHEDANSSDMTVLRVTFGYEWHFHRSSGSAQTTLKRYFGLLEATFLTEMLPAWSGGRTMRLVNSPKVFLGDTGLLSYSHGG